MFGVLRLIVILILFLISSSSSRTIHPLVSAGKLEEVVGPLLPPASFLGRRRRLLTWLKKTTKRNNKYLVVCVGEAAEEKRDCGTQGLLILSASSCLSWYVGTWKGLRRKSFLSLETFCK